MQKSKSGAKVEDEAKPKASHVVDMNTVRLAKRSVKQVTEVDTVTGSLYLGRRSSDMSWHLELELPSGRVSVDLTTEQFSNMMSTQLQNVDVKLLGSARHAGLTRKMLSFNIDELPADVRKEQAWENHKDYSPGGTTIPLSKYPKLLAWVKKNMKYMGIPACVVHVNFSQRATTLSITGTV